MIDMKNEKSLGLMDCGRRSPGHDFPVSRDWEDIDCKATGCLYNRSDVEKCMVPSKCKIGDMGECTGFEVKPFNPKQVNGD